MTIALGNRRNCEISDYGSKEHFVYFHSSRMRDEKELPVSPHVLFFSFANKSRDSSTLFTASDKL